MNELVVVFGLLFGLLVGLSIVWLLHSLIGLPQLYTGHRYSVNTFRSWTLDQIQCKFSCEKAAKFLGFKWLLGKPMAFWLESSQPHTLSHENWLPQPARVANGRQMTTEKYSRFLITSTLRFVHWQTQHNTYSHVVDDRNAASMYQKPAISIPLPSATTFTK